MAATREKVIQQAERLVARGKVEAAIREYRKVLADNPRDTNTLNRVGDLYARLERNDEAIALFSRIAEHYSDDGFFVKAIAIYKKIIKLDPTRLDIYERLAELYHRQGLVNEARTQYQVLADYFQKHNDPAAATAICRRMVELEPANPSHRARLADLLEQQGAIEEAIAEYRTIAGQLIASGQWDGATRVFEKALDVDPENLDFLREAIQSLRAAGQDGPAARLLAAAARRSPGIERRLGDIGPPLAMPGPAAAEKPATKLPLVHPRPKGEAPAAAPAEPTRRPPPPAPRAEPPVYIDDHGAPPPASAPRVAAPPSAPPRGRPSIPGDAEIELVLEDDPSATLAKPVPRPAPGAPPVPEVKPAPRVPAAAERPPPPAPPQAAASASVLPAAPAPAVPRAAPPGAPLEFDLELDEDFVFDLDDDATPASQVAPPPDMLEKPPRPPAEVPRFEPAAARAAVPPPAEEEAEQEAEVDLSLSGVMMLGTEAPVAEPATAEPPAPPPLAEAPEWEAPPEFDLANELAEAPEVAFSGAPGLQPFEAEAEPELDIDADLLERTAAELEPRVSEHEDDLITEAEVLAKYGLREKALERLEEAFALNPNHLGAYALQIGLYLELGRLERVAMLANEMGAIAAELGEAEPWGEVRERLIGAGFRIEGERRVFAAPVAAPAAEPPPAERAAPELASEPVTPATPVYEPEAALDLEAEEIDLTLEPLDVPPLGGDLWPALATPEPEVVEAASAEVEVPEAEVGEQLSPLPAFVEPEAPPAFAGAGSAEEAAPLAPAVTPPPAVAPAPPAPKKKKPGLADLDATLAAIAGTVQRKPAKRPAAPAPPIAAAPIAASGASLSPPPAARAEDGGGLFDLKSIGADVEAEAQAAAPPPPALEPALPAVLPPAPASADDFAATADDLDGIEIFAAEPSAPALDDADLSWLDEASAQAAGGPGADHKIFEAEEGFFDLAAELEEELKKEEAIHGESLFAQPHEQSLEEIVEGFKRGVAEHLSPEDYETHFNLGIAYREMGLLDEAIGEFQLAAKHPQRLVDCCSMLGMCFIDKGLPELAVKWYRRALDNPSLTENESLGLLYDLGSAYLLTGERDSAYKTFVDIYGVNTNYRDVVALLKELGH